MLSNNPDKRPATVMFGFKFWREGWWINANCWGRPDGGLFQELMMGDDNIPVIYTDHPWSSDTKVSPTKIFTDKS